MRDLLSSSRERAAAIVLIGGLIAATVFVAMSPAVSVPGLHETHGDAFGLHDVAKIHVPGWSSPDYDPFADGRFRLLTLLLAVAYLMATTAIGATLVRLLPGADAWPRPVRVLAAFLPGYLMVLAPLQLVFAAIPIPAASWVALVLVIGAALAIHRRALPGLPGRLRAAGARTWLIVGGGVLGSIALAALWRVQAGRNFMANDSVITLLLTAEAELAAKGTIYLLQWDQQSDEWLFSAPLMFTSRAGEDYLLPLYLAASVGLASFACLLYGLVSSFAPRRRVLAGTLSAGVVLAATPAIFPIYYISLFGGQNPALWLGHEGRYIGIVAPWIAAMLVGRVKGRAAIAAVGFATLGLGFLSVHVTVFVVAGLVTVLLWRGLPRPSAHTLGRAVQVAAIALGAFALATPLVTYGLLRRVPWPNQLGWLLLAGAAAAGVALLLVLLADRRRDSRPPSALVRPAGLWILVLAIGFVLSNNLTANMTDGATRDILGLILPGYDRPVSSRALLGDSPLAGLTFPLFIGQECWITGHCLSIGGYVASYGFMTITAFAGWLTLARVDIPEDTRASLRGAWLLCVAALAAAFTLVDFTGAAQSLAWILTRFIEVPYYALLVLAVIALVGVRDRVTAWIASAVFLTWTILPLLANQVPVQLVKNADWYLQVITP